MTSPLEPNALQAATTALNTAPLALGEAVSLVPSAVGIYAWWAAPTIFADLPGTANGSDPAVRLLYLGIAERKSGLRTRIVKEHLARSGSSTLRRTLAGLLMSTERYETAWTDRVVLVAADELRLTAWMHANLRLTWFACEDPEQHEKNLITSLRPPLNLKQAVPSAALTTVKAAKVAYTKSAGPRPLAP
ncbi:GIY-YIG nuclease family protein [Catellatospora sp. NPDC049111]|uniref:GIY-YIG nuclease family protein n=1 Tax=Catellatospora sp. NPDC049111 TaxID=3155271 RepID=UPI0033CEE9C0